MCSLRQLKIAGISEFNRLHYIFIFSKSQKKVKLVSSLPNWAKDKLKMFAVICTIIWPNFILMLPRILKKQSKQYHCWYAVMSRMTSQIFDICGFIKSAKIKYLENKILVFCQIKSIHDTLRAIIWQKNNFL